MSTTTTDAGPSKRFGTIGRRPLIGTAVTVVGAACLGKWALPFFSPIQADHPGPTLRDEGNFRAIYQNPKLRAEFRNFLTHVFHLYPEIELDALIAECVSHSPEDPAVYRELTRRLESVTPFLGSLRYSLPALRKQKAEMTAQTKRLLGRTDRIQGYLEIGSHGRYYEALGSELAIDGPVYTTAIHPPTFSVEEIVDRAAIELPGTALAWTDYAPITERDIPSASLDLITVYIGLHHATDEARPAYVRSLHRALAKNGRLIVRDHDVTNEAMNHLVGLAHDVFNVGTKESWATNANERRNFYSLTSLIETVEEAGFVAHPERLLQDGDPTKNTLLCFSKV